MTLRITRLTAATVALAAAFVLTAAPAAMAASPTAIEFVGTPGVDAEFGTDWSLQLAVSVRYAEGPTLRLTPVDGTVDVYLSGVGGVFASELPIQPDGTVYVSQPLDQPLLGAGEYEVSAIYNPAGGGQYDSSQTTEPATLRISALGVTPSVEVSTDATVSPYPLITARLSGSYIESAGGAPSGTWSFSVARSGEDPEFTAKVAQKNGGADPVQVEIDSRLDDGADYTVTTVFTPVEELAAGIEVAGAPTAQFSTPGSTLLDSLGTRLPFPWWLVLAIGALLVALVATVVVLALKISRRGPSTPNTRIPGEPENVEELSWSEVGLDDVDERSSTTWLLSDIESGSASATAVTPADAPTERLETPKGDGANGS